MMTIKLILTAILPILNAKFGKKESNGKGWYGYKSHTSDDAETELVTAVITTPANETDESQLTELIDKERAYRGEDAIRRQGGDKGYVGHTEDLEERNILDYTVPRNNMKRAKAKRQKQTLSASQKFKIQGRAKICRGQKKTRIRQNQIQGQMESPP
jgi:hypothetical protein